MVGNADYLSLGGNFTCPKCQKKSRLSKLPEEPGLYKITCFYCKHQILHKIDAPEEEPVLQTAAALAKEEETPNPTVNIFPVQEETKEAVRLDEEILIENDDSGPASILKTKDVEKPFFEVKKIQVPLPPPKEAPPAGVEETIRMPSLWDEFLYYIPPFLKNRFLMLTVMFLLSLSLLILLPLKAGYDEAKLELDSLLKELGKNKPSRILDRDGNKVSEIYQKKTGSMKLAEYPELLRNIILTVEDRSFYKHGGIDFAAIIRAGYKNLIHMRYIQGASTITQQLARILINDRRKSFFRKFREAMVAAALESRLSKDEILEAYLNQVYLGHGAFGIENASNYYFSKKPSELDPMEMILIASLTSAPNKYSPFKFPSHSLSRIKTITNTLAEQKIISEDYREKVVVFFNSLKQPASSTVFGSRYDMAPFVTEHVREILKAAEPNINIYDVGGYTVETTLESNAQELVPALVKEHLESLRKRKIVQQVKVRDLNSKAEKKVLELQAAVIGLDPQTGGVLFMHGGGEEFHSGNQFNRAIQMRRQTGSAIKPIIYSAAVDLGLIYPSMIMLDQPLVIRGGNGKSFWSPDNFGDVYEGEISVRDALAKSKNTIAVQIGERLGLANLEKYFAKYFFPDETERGKRYRSDLTVSLGSLEISPLEMASAFSAFANDGNVRRPFLIRKITDSDGKEIFNSEKNDEFNLKVPPERKVIESDTADIMVSMMRGSANASGVRSTGYTGELAGKTGTTNDHVDTWFAGVKPRLSMAVWIGYDDATYGMGRQGMGATFAAPLWGKIGQELSKRKLVPEEKFQFSRKAQWASVCRESGLPAGDDCTDKRQDLFTKTSKPASVCRFHSRTDDKELLKKLFQ